MNDWKEKYQRFKEWLIGPVPVPGRVLFLQHQQADLPVPGPAAVFLRRQPDHRIQTRAHHAQYTKDPRAGIVFADPLQEAGIQPGKLPSPCLIRLTPGQVVCSKVQYNIVRPESAEVPRDLLRQPAVRQPGFAPSLLFIVGRHQVRVVPYRGIPGIAGDNPVAGKAGQHSVRVQFLCRQEGISLRRVLRGGGEGVW